MHLLFYLKTKLPQNQNKDSKNSLPCIGDNNSNARQAQTGTRTFARSEIYGASAIKIDKRCLENIFIFSLDKVALCLH